jgi:hypothetical protein
MPSSNFRDQLTQYPIANYAIDLATIAPQAAGVYALATFTAVNPAVAAVLYVSGRVTTLAVGALFNQIAKVSFITSAFNFLAGTDKYNQYGSTNFAHSLKTQTSVPFLLGATFCSAVTTYGLDAIHVAFSNKEKFTAAAVCSTASSVASIAFTTFGLVTAGVLYTNITHRAISLLILGASKAVKLVGEKTWDKKSHKQELLLHPQEPLLHPQEPLLNPSDSNTSSPKVEPRSIDSLAAGSNGRRHYDVGTSPSVVTSTRNLNNA